MTTDGALATAGGAVDADVAFLPVDAFLAQFFVSMVSKLFYFYFFFAAAGGLTFGQHLADFWQRLGQKNV